MGNGFLRRLDRVGPTRVSVSGSGGVFHVRIGAGDAVDAAQVRVERGDLRCSCGGRNGRACSHVESLIACGFLEEPGNAYSQAEAA